MLFGKLPTLSFDDISMLLSLSLLPQNNWCWTEAQNPINSLTKMGKPVSAIWAVFNTVLIAVIP